MRSRLLVLIAMLTAAFMGCGKGSPNGTGKNVLSGNVTIDSKVAPEMAIVVVGPKGETAGGTTDPTGRYTIPDPPQGRLQFYFIPAGQTLVLPERYTRQGNELAFDYTDGNQTYNIELKP